MLYPIRDLFFRRKERLEGKIPDFYSYDLDENLRFKLIKHILNNSEEDELFELVSNLEMELGREIQPEYDYLRSSIYSFLEYCSTDEFLSLLKY